MIETQIRDGDFLFFAFEAKVFKFNICSFMLFEEFIECVIYLLRPTCYLGGNLLQRIAPNRHLQ
jgi:hypothetical protein